MDIEAIASNYQTYSKQNIDLTKKLSELNQGLKNPPDRSAKKILEKIRNETQSEKESILVKIDLILAEYISELIIVPGDEKRFENFAGFPVEVVDLGKKNKGALLVDIRGSRPHDGFSYSESYKTDPALLLEKRVIGIIEAQLTQSDWTADFNFKGTERIYYGIPVRKIEQK